MLTVIETHSKKAPGFSQANFNKAPTLLEHKPAPLVRQKTYAEETKVAERPSNYENFKRKAYATPADIGMVKQDVQVPQKPKHMMKFCLGEKDNKLLQREVKTSDHLDMYTSKVNHTNARVNLDMQSRRAVGMPGMGSATAVFPGTTSNLLMQKHGRDKLIRAPFMWG